jgi:hypothetical protein
MVGWGSTGAARTRGTAHTRAIMVVAALLLDCAGCGGDAMVVGGGLQGQGGSSGAGGTTGSTTTVTTTGTTSTGSTTSWSSTTQTTCSTTTQPCGTGDWCVTCCSDCQQSECTNTYCGEQLAACDAEPDCADLAVCFAGCNEPMCGAVCRQLYSAGYDPLMALYTCQQCEACPADCMTPADWCPVQY